MKTGRYAEYISTGLSVGGVILALVSVGVSFAETLRVNEALIGGVVLLLAALAGASSLYIARASKSLSAQQRIFISYSSEKKDAAQKLRDLLVEEGAVVFLDLDNLRPGDDLNASINAAIESSNTVVAMLSDPPGNLVSRELKSAIDKHVPVVVVVNPGAPRPPLLEKAHDVFYIDTAADLGPIAKAALQAR
jgi:uncharacterized membrane protein